MSARPTASQLHVRSLCRSAAARALLSGTLASCTHAAPQLRTVAPVAPRPVDSHAAQVVPAAPEYDPLAEDAPQPPQPRSTPEGAQPLLHTHRTNVQSGDGYRPFPCHVRDDECALADPASESCHPGRRHIREEDRIRMMQLARDANFLEINVVEPNPILNVPTTSEHFGLWGRAGTECADAKDHLACVGELDNLRSQLSERYSCHQLPCSKRVRTFGIVTRGDDVIALRSPADFRKLLGKIDTPVEAWLMLMAEGQQSDFGCNNTAAQHRRRGDHYELIAATITQLCVSGKQPLIEKEFRYRVSPDGKVTRTRVKLLRVTERCIASGRRPAGFRVHAQPPGPAGALLAQLAELEHASVQAFALLAHELRSHGAPAPLCARARAAARDEIRHTRLMRKLARRHGVQARTRRHARPELPRDLFTMALENVREGCVRELFGALVAHVQGSCAQDGEVRASFADIARDEADHAALALDLHAFFLTRLTQEQQAMLAIARREALAELRSQLTEPTDEEHVVCGMPTRAQAEVLFEALAAVC